VGKDHEPGFLARMRCELAAATRMLVGADILGYSGHLSARLPGDAEFLIQPVNDVRAQLAPERLLVSDLDGIISEGDERPPSELPIHAEIYRSRPDVGAVAHFHHDPTTMFSMVADRPIVPVKNHAARWASGVPVYPHSWHVDTREKGKELARDLGHGHAAMLRGHGQVIVAEDTPRLFADVIHFVENAQGLAQAHVLGEVVPLTAGECAEFLADFDRLKHAEKLWKYYRAVYDSRLINPAQLRARPGRDCAP
jgi:L-ribulose-5-phosphate 4-epimerase